MSPELSDHVDCPNCGGTGEVERPKCNFEDCDQKMIREGDGWVCPFHREIML